MLVFDTVVRDEKGLLVSIGDVDHIEPVDLGDIPLGLISLRDRAVIPIQPLSASVSFDEIDALYLAEVESVGVTVHAETRELLKAAIEDDIAVLWSRYACTHDEKLTRAARALKSRMRAAFREVSNAA